MRSLPLALPAIAQLERLPVRVIADAFDLTVQEVLTTTILFRDLLISRARERGLVSVDWEPRGTSVAAVLRELSVAISASWTLLLTARELEEKHHIYHVLRVVKTRYISTRKETHHG